MSDANELDIDETDLDNLIRSYNIPPQPHILSMIENAGNDNQ